MFNFPLVLRFGDFTGGRTPLPAGRVAPPTPSIPATLTAEGTAPRAAVAAGATTTTNRVV
jgi:hypothetical protein